MSFLERLRKSQAQNANWKTLDNPEQVDQLIADSYQKPVMIFKHSTTCGISADAKHRLEAGWNFPPEQLDFYYLDLLNHRSVSNLVAEKLGVRHESPQLIYIKDGQAVADASHHAVSSELVEEWLF